MLNRLQYYVLFDDGLRWKNDILSMSIAFCWYLARTSITNTASENAFSESLIVAACLVAFTTYLAIRMPLQPNRVSAVEISAQRRQLVPTFVRLAVSTV